MCTSLVCGSGDGVRDLECFDGDRDGDIDSSVGLRGLGDGVRDLGGTLGMGGKSVGSRLYGGLELLSTGGIGGGSGVRLADRRLVGICIGFP